MFARQMRYCDGVMAKSLIVGAWLQQCSATPDLSFFVVDNVSSVFVKSVFLKHCLHYTN